MKLYKDYFKGCIGSLIALVGIVFTSPIMTLIMLILMFSNRGNPFFVQARPGKKNKLFKLIKFKTMDDNRDELGNLLPDSERLTKIGSYIRKTSLDELPQLLNVLKGDMCLVGPRPLLVEYLTLYSKEQAKRHDVKPGITGWAQINGRNNISWNEKFILDIWYVNNVSFMLDVKIFFITIIKVFRKEGISAKNNVTMSKFTGDK